MKMMMTDLELIYYCAFKYVIGKDHDLVKLVADSLMDKESWSEAFMQQVLDEIRKCEAEGKLGLDMDVKKWFNVKSVFMARSGLSK